MEGEARATKGGDSCLEEDRRETKAVEEKSTREPDGGKEPGKRGEHYPRGTEGW